MNIANTNEVALSSEDQQQLEDVTEIVVSDLTAQEFDTSNPQSAIKDIVKARKRVDEKTDQFLTDVKSSLAAVDEGIQTAEQEADETIKQLAIFYQAQAKLQRDIKKNEARIPQLEDELKATKASIKTDKASLKDNEKDIDTMLNRVASAINRIEYRRARMFKNMLTTVKDVSSKATNASDKMAEKQYKVEVDKEANKTEKAVQKLTSELNREAGIK